MTLTYCIKAYDTNKENESVVLFDSNREPMFDDLDFLTHVLRK